MRATRARTTSGSLTFSQYRVGEVGDWEEYSVTGLVLELKAENLIEREKLPRSRGFASRSGSGHGRRGTGDGAPSKSSACNYRGG